MRIRESRERDLPALAAVYDDIARRYPRRLANLGKDSAENEMNDQELQRYRAVLAELLRLERKTAVRLRNEGRINDEVLRKIEHE